ncbi:MAG TPA: 2-succinyl-5-enolpyruvyl-6-hydroxy-3-cyclohexene-1-carboxylic-acid synthase, partial [Prolixibacteraceae bacterium]|nr:2-succinyl-5-enolpyruvyl-6-hydroxy-3-cyclohexene-1-carboxylic-acid synthase [Prolixibacteraceae bacterium]
MDHHLQHIADLVEICRQKGIRNVVVSPGSRNAPLIERFYSCSEFRLHSCVDERSAGYFALGLSLATQKPVALLCTSGTAALNYSPALAEAFYQHVPLVALTADRPEELIDQQDNQTIRQRNVFRNFVKASLQIERPGSKAYRPKQQHGAIDSILDVAMSGIKGPVHINVPIAEPLYVSLPDPDPGFRISSSSTPKYKIPRKLARAWNKHPRRMILCGQMLPDEELNQALNTLAQGMGIVVLAEALSNIRGETILSEIERILMSIDPDDERFHPTLLLSFGGPVVSKSFKKWLQKQKNITHFRIAEEMDHIDTYRNISGFIRNKPVSVFQALSALPSQTGPFAATWHTLYAQNKNRHKEALDRIPFCDLKVFEQLIALAPENWVLHLGNSSPVRYAQLFDLSKFDQVYANRGVSGIDGCLSTAAGFASQSDKTNLLILGDLSFLYDSNALWNSKLPPNLKIVVIGNGGGGIFRLIPGPSQLKAFEEFIEARQN